MQSKSLEFLRTILEIGVKFFCSSEYRKFLADQVLRHMMISSCIDKASRAYKILTGYPARHIAPREVEQAVFCAPNHQELLANLKTCSFGGDDQFVLLLYFAIINTYTPSTPPWALGGAHSYTVSALLEPRK